VRYFYIAAKKQNFEFRFMAIFTDRIIFLLYINPELMSHNHSFMLLFLKEEAMLAVAPRKVARAKGCGIKIAGTKTAVVLINP
jgi:hypothetical protein